MLFVTIEKSTAAMGQPNNGSSLYAVFLLAAIVYWTVFMIVKAMIRKLWPKTYAQLRQDPPKKLTPVVIMVVRIIFGLAVSLPSCIMAGATTPWGYGRELNTAGQICVVSQGLVWVNELQAMMDYSIHLMVHHLVCIAVMANIILAPNIHQVKPLYIFFASQIGDLGPGSILILKTLGKRPNNSMLLRCIVVVATGVIIFSKTTVHLWGFGMAFQSPHRVGDWLWGICLLFFGIYCLNNAHKNLTWIGLFKVVSKPAGLAIGEKFRIPLLNLYVALGALAALVFSLFVYSFNLDRGLKTYEIGLTWYLHAIMFICGTMGVFIISLPWINHYSANLFYQLGSALLCLATFTVQSLKPDVYLGIDVQPALTSASLGIALWEAIVQTGTWISVTRDMKQSIQEEITEQANAESILLTARRNRRKAAFHLVMASMNAAILLGTYALPSTTVSFLNRGNIALGAHALVQVVVELCLRPKPTKLLSNTKGKGTATSTLFRAIPAIGELLLAVNNLSLQLLIRLAGDYLGMILMFCIATGSGNTLLHRVSGTKTSKCISRTILKQVMNPMNFSVALAALLQAIVMKEVLAKPDYEAQSETSTGFQNLRLVINALPTIPCFIVMGMLYWAAKDVATTLA